MLSHAEAMLNTHPRPIGMNQQTLLACLQACYDCAQACTTCADACLGEKDVHNLVRCIRLNQDCADICGATGRLLSRHTESPSALLRHMLQTCEEACQACAAECQTHAHHHEHCAVCAEACRQCAEACHALMTAVPTTQPAR
jgi:hypothetical protein